MQLDKLKMNRMLYRSAQAVVTDNPVQMSSEVYSRREASSKDSAQKGKKDASEVITGTVITCCLIKSSDQDDRIEIGQNLDSILNSVDIGALDFSQAKGLDYLAAYSPGGHLGFLLTGIGAAYLGYSLVPNKIFSWYGSNANSLVTQSQVVWFIDHVGIGKYLVTHNLESLAYAVNVISTDSGVLSVYVLCCVSEKGLNSFIINTFDLIGNPINSNFDCVIDVYK